jgi:hypothetical protein
MKKNLYLLLLPLFGFILSVVIIESSVRAYEYFSKPPLKWSDRPRYYFQAQSTPTLQDYNYPDSKKSDKVFRIAVIGDSYTFAPYMQFTDAFPKVLERMLNLQPRDQPNKVEVINYGVPAYSTSHEIETTINAIKSSADLIILQITLNDPELKPIRPVGITQFSTWGPLKLVGWQAKLANYWHTGKLIAERLHNTQTKTDYIKYFIDLFENQKTYSGFESSIKKIIHISNRRKIPLIGVVFPIFGVPINKEYPFSSCHYKIAELFRSTNTLLLDLLKPYENIPVDRLQVIPGEDRHPNEIAHRIAAESIYEFLVANNLIPKEAIIENKSSHRHGIYPELIKSTVY